MNATILTREADALDRAQKARTTPFVELDEDGRMRLPVLPATAYSDPTWVARYEGIPILKLSCGLYYTPETGAAWTIEHARADIDAWWARREPKGFGDWVPA